MLIEHFHNKDNLAAELSPVRCTGAGQSSQTFCSWAWTWTLRLLICCCDRDTASSFFWDAWSLSCRSDTSLSSSMILERSDTVATYSTKRREGRWRKETSICSCCKNELLPTPVYFLQYDPIFLPFAFLFSKVNGLFLEFLWKKKPHRLAPLSLTEARRSGWNGSAWPLVLLMSILFLKHKENKAGQSSVQFSLTKNVEQQ